MSDLKCVCDLHNQTWTFHYVYNSSWYIDVEFVFVSDKEETVFDNLTFSVKHAESFDSWPKDNNSFISSTNQPVLTHRIFTVPGSTDMVKVSAVNAGIEITDGLEVRIPLPQPYPSWTLDWNDPTNWVAPIPKPEEDGSVYVWNEENLAWVVSETPEV